ncbi:uncharacterized protein LOC126662120 [Mercurialis annua]|uniref:uncharacterized protein LOC126662120 n=1 Tax=Mercurialis annua TaxID=3986 RepID=UPI00215F4D60|nr:uncharacterized protein LOC126662120 [Mercurialis annua]
MCPRCQTVEETSIHCLKNCEEVRGLWLMSPLNLRVDKFPNSSVQDWLTLMFGMMKCEEVKTFVMTMWVIWNDRNNIVFNNKRMPSSVLFSCIPSMLDTSGGFSEERDVVSDAANRRWSPPPEMCLKINSDVAVSTEKGLSVLSAVCRDSSGKVIRSGVSFLHGCTVAEIAEAKAVSFGLSLARDLNYTRIICEMDAINVANRLCNICMASDYLQLVVDDCLLECEGRDVSFIYANRICNQVAHALAKWGIFFGRDCIFDGNVPFPVNELVTDLIL